jgi:hypothetical protein
MRDNSDNRSFEFGWPVGMPTCRPLASRRGLWEVRSSLTQKRIARILFVVYQEQMVLLHGFIKKTQHCNRHLLSRDITRCHAMSFSDCPRIVPATAITPGGC